MSLVLVTGATGQVARGVLPFLEEKVDLRLVALNPPVGDPRWVQVNLLDWDGLARAMNGVDAVLHLAVASGHSGTFEDDSFNDLRFDVNVKGTYHVFETARRTRVRRVVYVSSLMVIWGHGFLAEQAGPESVVPGDAKPNPVGTYALTKAMGEGIARYYGVKWAGEESCWPPGDRHHHGDPAYPKEVLTLRIAAPLDITDPDLRNKPVRPQQVPFPDLAQAFTRALTVPLDRYEVVTIVGDSSRRLCDLTQARQLLGYKPAYYLDDLGVTFADPFLRD